MKKSILIFTDSQKKPDQELIQTLTTSGYRVSHIGPELPTSPDSIALGADLLIFSNASENGKTIDTIRSLKKLFPLKPVLLISPDNSDIFIIESFKSDICDFLKYPPHHKKLVMSIAEIIDKESYLLPPEKYSPPFKSHIAQQFIGESSIMKEIKRRLMQIAETDVTLLITGETGTGKDLASEYVHFASKRSCNPYVVINCAALPESLIESELFGYEKGAFTGADTPRKGKFELAEGGTIFLDEIGEIPLHLQAKLLHAIEKKSILRIGGNTAIPVDVRIIAATNKDMNTSVKTGNFRIDLYYRLNVANVLLPPLRERKHDLSFLVAHIKEVMSKRYNIEILSYSENDMELMHRYDWPGNIRELQNIVEMSFITVLGTNSRRLKLLPEFKELINNKAVSTETDRQQLVSILLANNWNKTETARTLNWSRMTVHRKMEKYNIVQERNRS